MIFSYVSYEIIRLCNEFQNDKQITNDLRIFQRLFVKKILNVNVQIIIRDLDALFDM